MEDDYKKRYDWLLINYYENNFKADRIEVYDNNSPIKPTYVVFSKRGGKLKPVKHGEKTTLGLFQYLKEGKKYKLEDVKKKIKEWNKFHLK